MRLLLASHGQTEWNALGRFQGHSDVPLNEHGRRQAFSLQRHLAYEAIQAIVTSDLRRAREMGEILAKPHVQSVRTDPRLRELCFGSWEGLTYAQIEQMDPIALAAWQRNPLFVSPPQGQRLADMARRLQDFLSDLTAQPQATTLLVAHRGSLRTLLCLLQGLPVERQWEFHLDLASLSEVEIVGETSRVVYLNRVPEVL